MHQYSEIEQRFKFLNGRGTSRRLGVLGQLIQGLIRISALPSIVPRHVRSASHAGPKEISIYFKTAHCLNLDYNDSSYGEVSPKREATCLPRSALGPRDRTPRQSAQPQGSNPMRKVKWPQKYADSFHGRVLAPHFQAPVV